MKRTLLAASLVLVAGTSVGCGGGPPTDASKEDFCGVFEDFDKTLSEMDAEASDEEFVKALKDVGEELEEVGTPEDIPDDARRGFEKTLEMIADLEDDATQEDMDKIEDELSEDEQKDTDAFDEYQAETCGDA